MDLTNLALCSPSNTITLDRFNEIEISTLLQPLLPYLDMESVAALRDTCYVTYIVITRLIDTYLAASPNANNWLTAHCIRSNRCIYESLGIRPWFRAEMEVAIWCLDHCHKYYFIQYESDVEELPIDSTHWSESESDDYEPVDYGRNCLICESFGSVCANDLHKDMF